MAGQPVVFAPGAVCPVGYLCIPGMEPMKLPDVQGAPPDVQPDVQVEPSGHGGLIPEYVYESADSPSGYKGYYPDLNFGTGVPLSSDSPYIPPSYDPAWDTEDIPAGASFDVRRGLLPTGTPSFDVTGREGSSPRGYSGSYGWRLPGGPGYAAEGGGFDPFNPWGGVDREYGFGVNTTPYEERWFLGDSLLPESYEDYIENITTITPSNPDIYPTTTGTISSDAGLAYPTIADSYDIEPPKELTLWGNPVTATSDVNIFSSPEFIHPYYDWLNSDDFDDMELDFEDMESEEMDQAVIEAQSDFMAGLLNSLGIT